jgi:hypothetical protein
VRSPASPAPGAELLLNYQIRIVVARLPDGSLKRHHLVVELDIEDASQGADGRALGNLGGAGAALRTASTFVGSRDNAG